MNCLYWGIWERSVVDLGLGPTSPIQAIIVSSAFSKGGLTETSSPPVSDVDELSSDSVPGTSSCETSKSRRSTIFLHDVSTFDYTCEVPVDSPPLLVYNNRCFKLEWVG